MTYSLPFLLHWAFKLTGQASLVKIHPVVDGWMAVIEDKRSGQTYKMHIVPIKSEKIVVPDTVEQLLDNGGF